MQFGLRVLTLKGYTERRLYTIRTGVKKTMKRLAVVIGLCGLFGNFGNPAAQAQAIDGVRVHVVPPGSVDARAYLTPEAALAVPPVDWDRARGRVAPAGPRRAEKAEPIATGDGGLPDPAAERIARRAFADAWREQPLPATEQPDGGASVDGPAGTNGVFTQYSENARALNTAYPQRAIGKIFSSGGTCSGSMVSGKNLMVTAAHCCYDRRKREFVKNMKFSPAHRSGRHPFGLFPATRMVVPNGWINVGHREFDICLVQLGRNARNQLPSRTVGWLGWMMNAGPIQLMHSLGYPGNVGGGRTMELCVAESYSGFGGTCGDSLNKGCNMTFGASGGPWIVGYKGINRVNSVVSGPACVGGTFGRTYNGGRFKSSTFGSLCREFGGC
jgi:V8-like Glu-specific endopeptidase